MSTPKRKFTHAGVDALVITMAMTIRRLVGKFTVDGVYPPIKVYPVPRGGVPVAYLLLHHAPEDGPAFALVDDPAEADVLVDDLIDSGETEYKWQKSHPSKPFVALLDKRRSGPHGIPWGWVIFPWEKEERSEDDTIVGTIRNRLAEAGVSYRANQNVAPYVKEGELATLQAEVAKRSRHLLDALVIDVDNDHNTQGTADRIAKMYCTELFAGRFSEPPRITTFPNAGNYDEMLISGPITVRSTCSHHFCPIQGRAWIGMVPGAKVAGLSKFNRIVDWFASRPQIQEELVIQIADYLERMLEPKGLAVVIEATHDCMQWRGVKESSDAVMATNVMRGVFKANATTRAEFFAMMKR